MYTKDGFHKALEQKLGDDAYLLLANGGHKKLTELLTAASLGANGNNTTLSVTVGGTTKTGSVTVPYASAAGSAPASDVYAWAKAATKPSYTLDEVNDGSSRKLANYLPLSGGTLTGYLTLAGSEANDISNVYNNNSVISNISWSTLASIRHSIKFPWYNTSWEIGNIRGDSEVSLGFGVTKGNSQVVFRVNDSGGWINESQIITSGNISSYIGSGGGGSTVYVGDGNSWYVLDHVYNGGERAYFQTSSNANIVSCLTTAMWAHVADPISGGNEFDVCDNTTSANRFWFNYIGRQGTTVAIDSYLFGNGRGSATATTYAGSYQNGSDIRNKTVVDIVNLSIEDISRAPIFKFYWKDGYGDSNIHVGTSAQYWKSVLPEITSELDNEQKTMSVSYDVAALASVVALAKKVEELEAKIENLLKNQ